jgi:transaldolase/glucose-6-phosphate isomerase
VLGINPFDQPDVEAAKVAARALTSAYETDGALPPEAPLCERDGIALYADGANAEALRRTAGDSPTLDMYLRAHLARIHPGDYFAMLAWIPMSDPHEKALQAIRHPVRDRFRVATCLGFGPRFLHSTGQATGDPGSGVFLQITCDDAATQIPGAAQLAW